MKTKRVDCVDCQHFEFTEKYKCNLGKRVMYRASANYWYFTDFLFPRYCNEFKDIP
jgi:hypothetical protein